MSARRIAIFFAIVGLAIAITVVVLALERLDVLTLPWRRATQTAIQVAVPPILADWATASAREFDGQVTVIPVHGLSAVGQFARMDAPLRPHAWIPEATFVAAIARDQGLSYETVGQSVAAADLAWGAFSSRAAVLSGRFGTLDWQAVHQAAVSHGWAELGGNADWGNFKLILASPTHSAEGLAALLSAAAAYRNRPDLAYDDVTDEAFLQWLRAIVTSVPNFGTLGPQPAESVATRGPSVGDAGLLAAAAWNRSQVRLDRWETFVVVAPQFTVRLDYPYLLRSDLDPAERETARRFGAFLLGRATQLADSGFAQATVSAVQVNVDTQAVLALLRWAERERIGQ